MFIILDHKPRIFSKAFKQFFKILLLNDKLLQRTQESIPRRHKNLTHCLFSQHSIVKRLPVLGYYQWSEFGKKNSGYRDLAPAERERTQRSSGEMSGRVQFVKLEGFR